MTKPQLLMDLDRTLFNTNDFVQDIWQLAARLYDLDAEEQLASTEPFRTYYGSMYDYNFYAQLAHATYGRSDNQVFNAAARQQLSARYLYADVTKELIAATTAVITFGNEPYQRLKLSLCPELSDTMCHFVLEPKGPFIARTYGSMPTVLVDDKCPQDGLPPTTRFIHLDRRELEPLHECAVESIANLGELIPTLATHRIH